MNGLTVWRRGFFFYGVARVPGWLLLRGGRGHIHWYGALLLPSPHFPRRHF